MLVRVKQKGKQLVYKWDQVRLMPGKYQANVPLEVTVEIQGWNGTPFRDYTLVTYAKNGAKITDIKGKTNMIHMDGKTPSGFKNSDFRGYKDPSGAKDYKISLKNNIKLAVKHPINTVANLFKKKNKRTI